MGVKNRCQDFVQLYPLTILDESLTLIPRCLNSALHKGILSRREAGNILRLT
jgi:hypothetical protein